MKLILRLLLILGLSLLLGLLATRAAIANAPEQPNEDYISEDIVIKDNAIISTPTPPSVADQRQSSIQTRLPKKQTQPGTRGTNSRRDYASKTYSKEEVIQLIKDYSGRYSISPDLPLRIAKCESGYGADAKNRSSTASGVFQYLSSTWAGTDEGKAGLSVFDADANVRAAIKYIASRGNASPWLSSKHCWS